MATENAMLSRTVEVYEDRYGDHAMRVLDSLVKSVARQPLNMEEFNGYVKHIPSEAQIDISKAKDIIEARWRAGLYDDVLEPVDASSASIRRNLRALGIRLP